MDDDRRTGVYGGKEVTVQAHLLHLFIGEDTDDDNVGAAAHIGKFGDGLGAQFADRLTFLGGPAERADVSAGFDETPDHRAAHAARPDESDARHRGCSMDSNAVSAAVKTEPSAADALAAMVAA